jgi:glycosyltransferase involved in cell wall biosynthesis
MRIAYVLLSPTFGMHQYTADLAQGALRSGHEVHVVTTAAAPRGRYMSAVTLYTPVAARSTGLAAGPLAAAAGFALQTRLGVTPSALPTPVAAVHATLRAVQPDLVHFSGPHVWNAPLLGALARDGIPTVHTLHDAQPHSGAGYGRLLEIWNRQVVRGADALLVHSAQARATVLGWGAAPERVVCTPLLHLFAAPARMAEAERLACAPRYEPWALFFGRFERYKGLDVLLGAWGRVQQNGNQPGEARLVLAGQGDLGRVWRGPLPPGVEVRARLIEDEEALDLFSRCGVVVLPYRDATQSALVAAAYFFRKPVIVTRTGALPEYVEPGETGWVVEPSDAEGLARGLEEALADPARLARMGAAGRAWVERERLREQETLAALYASLARRASSLETCR